ncbi:hypothetical protein HAHE_08910 [Haloferula helveola]|uniref:Uncharacterized protein n=1 Tax=Haloferula helveola TaxID=490095 RepID=A0ABN6H0K3_9BACT|nr:hypothetical protein HAHE_08910 [Haloferula helveola]
MKLRPLPFLIGLPLLGLAIYGISRMGDGAPEEKLEIIEEPANPTPEPSGPPESPPAEVPGATPPNESAVVPLGDERYRIGRVEFDKSKRTITVPAAVLMRENPVEYMLVTRKGKVHESVFVTDVEPRDIHVAALLMGMQPTAELGPMEQALAVPKGSAIQAWIEWDRNGPPAKINLHEALALTGAGGDGAGQSPAPATLWLYNGSRVQQDGTFVASRDGSVISIIRDGEALINYPGSTRDNDEVHIPNTEALPKVGHPVRIVFKLR